MPYKDPEKQRAYQREWLRKRSKDPDYREKRRLYREANKPWWNLGKVV